MGRPAKKKAYWESKKAELGRLQARREDLKRTPLMQKLKEIVWQKIEQIDPLEVFEIVGVTYVIKSAFELSEEITAVFIGKAQYLKEHPALLGSWAIGGILAGPFFGIFTSFFIPSEKEEKTFKELMDKPTAEILEWATALFLAVLFVKHGGEILGFMVDGGKGLLNLVTLFFAA